MITANIYQAKTNLSKLIQQVENGKAVVENAHIITSDQKIWKYKIRAIKA